MLPHFLTLLLRPERTWEAIRREEEHNSLHYLAHLLLLSLLPVACLFIGTTQVGWSLVEHEKVRLTGLSALQLSVLLYLTILLGTLIMGVFVRWMSYTFGAEPTLHQCIGFMAYVETPYLLAGLAALYPNRWLAVTILGLASLYSSFLLYIGLPVFMRIRSNLGFLYASAVWGVGLLVLVTILVSMILFWQYYLFPDYQRLSIGQ
jgi:hypothetical protein